MQMPMAIPQTAIKEHTKNQQDQPYQTSQLQMGQEDPNGANCKLCFYKYVYVCIHEYVYVCIYLHI